MGQKSHPQKIRSKYINSFFESNWFADNKNYKTLLHQDLFIKNFLLQKFNNENILINRFKIKRVLDSYNNYFVLIDLQIYPLNSENISFVDVLNCSCKTNIYNVNGISIDINSKDQVNIQKDSIEYYEINKFLIHIVSVLKSVVNENISLSINKIESKNSLFLSAQNDLRSFNRYKKENYFNEAIKLFYGFLFDDFFIYDSLHKKEFLSADLVSIFVSKYLSSNYDHKKFLEFIGVLANSCWKLQTTKLLGLKILIKGRTNGMDRSRKTWISVGSVPLHTIAKNIEYAQTKSITKYGSLGVKVWLHYSSKNFEQKI